MVLFRSLATVGGLTMVSRVLGFVRDILIALVLGAGPVADAFFVAFRFPNLFRRLFAEGAFNSAFVPLFARRLEEEGREAARRFAEQALAVLLTALLALTILAQIAMPWLMMVIAPGFAEEPAKFELAVQLTQITFPYLLFMSLIALQSGVLNSLHRFGHAAAAPILLNIVMILALAVVAPLTGMPGHVLAWAVAVAGICQFLWLVAACHRAGMALRLPLPRLTPAVRRLLRLMGPGVLGAGVMQINLLVGTIIATLQPGAVSYLYYADRIYQLPLGVIGAAVGVVLLPELTRSLRANRPAAAMDSMNRCLEFALLLTLPAAAALIAIPGPIISVLFERGAFDAEAAEATTLALAAFATGLPAYVLVKALAPAFFAREDTATPFRFGAISVVANVVLSLLLFQVLAFVGIALATAIASWLNVGLLAWRLHRSGFLKTDARLRERLPRTLVCSLVMGGALWVTAGFLEPALAGPLPLAAAALALLVFGGMGLFGGLALACGALRADEFRQLLRRRQRTA
jgi:putative peptidoglycan lipid II flippase